ncbi:MAG: hypothetical protein K2Y08_07495 [Alphaproteobacteria bacterium]|nr:hypothetical protein [Alphaproteobacteria bacterium]
MKLMILSAIFFPLRTTLLSQDQRNYSKYVNSDDQVSKLVVQCLGLTGIVIDGEAKEEKWPKPIYILNSRGLAEVVGVVQGKVNPDVSWFRQGERGTTSNSLLSPSTAREILKLSQQDFGFKNSALPKDKNYQGILILGTDAKDFNDRILFANELVQRGTLFNSVYLLVGRRKLEDFEKEAFPYLSLMNDEGTMAEEIFSKNASSILQNKKITAYSEPPEGRVRATTESTLHAFMKLKPPPGKYLSVSDGIYVPYQELVIQNVLDKHYPKAGITVECVGSADKDISDFATDEKILSKASDFLDNLSRILYNLDMRQSANSKFR